VNIDLKLYILSDLLVIVFCYYCIWMKAFSYISIFKMFHFKKLSVAMIR